MTDRPRFTQPSAAPVAARAATPTLALPIGSDDAACTQADEALRRSEKRLRDIIDGLGPSMFVGLMTPQGVVLEANRSALAASGLKPDDVVGKRFEDTYWWAYSADIQQQLREAIVRAAGGEGSRYDVRVRGPGAQLVDVEFSLQPVRDETGAVAFLVPSATVITERKQIELALRESNEQFRQLTDNITDAFWIRSPDMRAVHYISPAFEGIWGRTAASLHARPHEWADFIVAEDRERVLGVFAGLTADTPSVDVEYRIARPDGEVRWVRSRGFQVRDGSGALIRITGIVTDITEARQAAEALRASMEEFRTLADAMRTSEQQYRQIVETTTDGIIKVDGDARIVFVNRQFAEMLGYEPGEMIGVSLFAFMDAEARTTVRQSLDTPHRGMRGPVDTTYRHKDGRTMAVNVAISPLVNGDGRSIGSLGVVRDVTEQKKMQSQLIVSDRMASVGTLAAGVAHEINNPLAAVIANLDYIADRIGRAVGSGGAAPWSDAWLLEEVKGPLDDAREAAQRVRFIVRDLKIFSRSPVDEPRGPVDVQAIMESALRMAWNQIRHRARLVKEYGPVPGVRANEARLGQVFLNLVVNAAQAMPEGRAEHNEIRVITRLEGERVVIEVRDTGPGIPPEIIGRIFDAFFTTKGVGVGTGLGLAICQRIVTDMGGDLTVESEVGKGTMFRVALPVARDPEVTIPAPVEPAPVAGRRGRILLVDDEELVLRSVKRTLSKEHDVVAVGTAQEALARCVAGEFFDLILCDLMMPDMTGMDLHRELALAVPEQAGRMIFVTGGAFTEKAQQFLAETSTEYIEKPFHAANLRAIVQRYLRS